MSKIIVRLRNESEYLGYYILEDNETIKEQVLEELLQKENNYIETYFDSKDKKLKQRYIEIPKSQEQLLNEQVEELKKQEET